MGTWGQGDRDKGMGMGKGMETGPAWMVTGTLEQDDRDRGTGMGGRGGSDGDTGQDRGSLTITLLLGAVEDPADTDAVGRGRSQHPPTPPPAMGGPHPGVPPLRGSTHQLWQRSWRRVPGGCSWSCGSSWAPGRVGGTRQRHHSGGTQAPSCSTWGTLRGDWGGPQPGGPWGGGWQWALSSSRVPWVAACSQGGSGRSGVVGDSGSLGWWVTERSPDGSKFPEWWVAVGAQSGG